MTEFKIRDHLLLAVYHWECHYAVGLWIIRVNSMRLYWIFFAIIWPLLALVGKGGAAPASSIPVAPATSRITPDQFEYLGAFTLPAGEIGPSSFAFGGKALAYRPDGDAAGTDDGYPGSLFLVGHPYQQRVAEISIPIPTISITQSASTLNRATVLQPFADITAGLAAAMSDGDPRIDGLAYLEAQPGQNTPKLYWTVHRWYNVAGDNFLGHGWSEVTLDAPQAQGGWRLADFHNQMTAGYLLSAPQAWADQFLGGKRLLAGLNVFQGVSTSSQGPALFAYAPWLHPEQPPPNQATLGAQPLFYYPYTEDNSKDLPGHKIPDKWDDGEWITLGEQQAVIIVGRIALGETRYGEPLPDDCDQNKGYHGDPYQPAILFYDPTDLAAVAQGEKQPWEVLPYARWNPEAHLFPSCEWYLTGAAYDADHALLYLVQSDADHETNEFEPYPLIHVFRVHAANEEPVVTHTVYLPLTHKE